MSQEPEVETEQSKQGGQTEQTGQTATSAPVARAEQLMTDWGHSVGFFVGTARLRLQNAVKAIRDEADRMDQPTHTDQSSNASSPTSHTPQEQNAEARQLALQKAEQQVDIFTHRVGAFFTATGLQIRRTGAFVREDAEDIWAEAQSIRHQRRQQ